jgi:hypothetical protein
MITGLVHVRYSLPLRVAATVAGVDIEFGPTATRSPYQRIDVLSSEFRARDLIARYGVVVGKPKKGKQYQEADASLMGRAKLFSVKDTSND